jgi:predicted dehydrogenase
MTETGGTDMKKKLIQIGVGGWGATGVEKALKSKEWELVGCVDASLDSLKAVQDVHGFPANRCYTSVAEAAEATGAEAALVVVPPAYHLPVAVEAFEAGLHVLVEKPLADTMESGFEMVRQAEQHDRILMVSQNYRYKAAPRAVASVLKQGWLGGVSNATIEFRRAPHFAVPDERHGFTHYKFVEDMCIHHFDQLRGVLADEPVAVYAQFRNPEWSWFAAPPVVNATIELEGGGIVNYFGSWISRGRQTTWDGSWFIDCDNGQVEWADNRVRVRPEEIYYTVHLDGFAERDGWMEADLTSDLDEDRVFTLGEFGRCVAENRQPETSGRDNLKSIALTYAVRDSALSGERVELAGYLDPERVGV